LLLEGRNDELIDTLRDRMVDASEQQRFEEAAQLRDRAPHGPDPARSTAEGGDGTARRSRRLRIEGWPERQRHSGVRDARGRVIERLELVTDSGIAVRDADVLQATVQQFYEMRVPPSEIDLPMDIEDP
jgi:excinuclease UvrABC nuclease subunit